MIEAMLALVPPETDEYHVSVVKRIMDRSEVRPTGCIEYMWGRHMGYGVVNLRNKRRTAHRTICEVYYGPPPEEGMVAAHWCDNPPCVNPAHLCWMTKSENSREAVARGRNSNARKTHCKRGHEYTDENTYVNPAGSRSCRKCSAMKQAQYREASA